MNKREFLKELRRELKNIPFEEQENAVSYYEEYLDEAGIEREMETISNLGSPKSIAAQIKTDYAVKTPTRTPQEGVRKIWIVILAILASPVAIPLVVGLVACISGILIAIASVVFAFGVAFVALVGGGLFSMVISFTLLPDNFLTFLFFLGGGIATAGIGILFGYLTYFVARQLTGASTWILGKILNRIKRREAV